MQVGSPWKMRRQPFAFLQREGGEGGSQMWKVKAEEEDEEDDGWGESEGGADLH